MPKSIYKNILKVLDTQRIVIIIIIIAHYAFTPSS